MKPDHYRRYKHTAAVLLTLLFATAVLTHEHSVRRHAHDRIRAHADIVADALWNLNPGGAKPYLSLACKSDDYSAVTVLDLHGREFLHIESREQSPLETLLKGMRLIPQMEMSAVIRHDSRVIGTIKAVWNIKSIFFDATLFVGLVLIYVVFKLNLRLVRGRDMLEDQVERRTRKLTKVNDQLTALNRRLTETVEQHKKSRAALVESEKRYRTFFEENIAASYISTPAGRLVACNDAFVRMFGFSSKAAAMATPLTSVFYHAEDRDRFLSDLRLNRRVSSHETRYRKQDGSDLYLIENASAVLDDQGGILQIRGFLIDVSEVRALESKLLQACKMETIGHMAGSVAHDFNNFLFPILGHCEMLMMDTPPGDPVHEQLEAIRSSALRAGDLVSRILTFSRQEVRDVKPICFKATVAEALSLIRSLAPANVDIHDSLPQAEMIITADAGQVHQVVMNLLTNACHAMEPGGGRLSVSMTTDNLPGDTPGLAGDDAAFACLSVLDTGPGLDDSIREKMFEPFFTTKEKGKGTGLGLSIVQGVVSELGGRIEVEIPDDGGTCFKVYLPLETHVPVDRSGQDNPPGLQTGEEHIVLVDDDPAIAAMMTQLLERLGYSVTAFTQSLDVPLFVQAHVDQVDLVISDMSMPDMGGDELAKMLQEIKPGVPVMICTGFGDTLCEEKTRHAGITRVLMKPVSLEKLSSAVRQALDELNLEN